MNLLHFVVDTSVIESMQGIIGFKSYIPKSKDLYNLTSTLRRRIYIEDPFMEVMELNANGIWAYDSLWALAEAVERAWVKLPPRNDNKTETGTDNLLDVDKIESSEHGPVLLKEILKSKMMGISGEFQFKNGIRKSSSNAFEIVNVIGKGERRVGVWKESHRERNLLSTNDLEGILWPGGTTSTPKGTRSLMGINGTKLLRVGVPSTRSFKELVSVYYDHQSNETKFTGFCIDVFKAAIELLPYRVPYQFVESTPNHSAITARTYVDFFHNFNHLVFRKGSSLVHDMSWAIEKLREEGELAKLEAIWFHSKPTYAYVEGSSNSPNALDLQNFGGLFLISGISLALALLLLLTFVLRQNRHVLKNYKFGNLLQYIGS
ncbi:hypothetical protein FEM48_Zijuj04G0124800 [Ziziphus jujuba var. spinosa]|uniref:Receptor ligand binding region domain-containing protein n=1 Tax=Ziziphus jujuba var. spinosa TaxID=714518 RepID=A0A978VJW2_ZIZJJ|nr:hypothetical protein FEM48_Zijuj04G0124800 [Ziziphus jujuba var. spinosa]